MSDLNTNNKQQFGNAVSCRTHYDDFLAEHYSWMFGDFEAKVEEFEKFFNKNAKTTKGLAVDLGCGSGFQSIALANLGYRVLSVDISGELLKELEIRSAGLNIKLINDDILGFPQYCSEPAVLISCMGDTLTHLESKTDVEQLFKQAFDALAEEGRFFLSFRENMVELHGVKRFIPVRADEQKIMTCFLEFDKQHINVNDLIYEFTGEAWKLKVSSYMKLRLSADWVAGELTKAGLDMVNQTNDKGFVNIVAKKGTGSFTNP